MDGAMARGDHSGDRFVGERRPGRQFSVGAGHVWSAWGPDVGATRAAPSTGDRSGRRQGVCNRTGSPEVASELEIQSARKSRRALLLRPHRHAGQSPRDASRVFETDEDEYNRCEDTDAARNARPAAATWKRALVTRRYERWALREPSKFSPSAEAHSRPFGITRAHEGRGARRSSDPMNGAYSCSRMISNDSARST
jgi:hypothetical protein